MNIVLFYFSGTGNTWWASLELKKALEELGNRVEVYSLENPLMLEKEFVLQKINEAGQIIIGYPVYGSDLPANMKEFVYNLPDVSDHKKFSAFCTQAAFSGDGSVFFKSDIEKKGYKFLQSFQINLTTNFNVAMLPFSLSKPAEGKKLVKIKYKATMKIKKIAAKIAVSEMYIEGKRFYQVLLGGLQRYVFRRSEKKMPKGFKFSKERCTKCKLCVRTCPTNNLSFDADTLDLIRGDNCLLCFRCYNFCPTLAINFGKKIKNPENYKRYKGPVEKLNISEIRK